MGILTAPLARCRRSGRRRHADRLPGAEARLAFRCFNDVRDQQGTRHRANSARVGAEPGRYLVHAVCDVTHEPSLAVLTPHATHTHVQDDRTGGHHIGSNDSRGTSSRDDNVRAAHVICQISSARMANVDRGVNFLAHHE